MNKLDIFNSKIDLLNFLGIQENFLYDDFSIKYNKAEVPKKGGGFRLIKAPSKKLKNIQRKVLDTVLFKIPLLSCVYGLLKKKNIKNNALAHEFNLSFYLLNLDIEKFFDNITFKCVLKVFLNAGFNKENASILTKICTVDGSLPQGAPTSPYLASLVCVNMDKKIYQDCQKRHLTYTRYFDDISISGIYIAKEVMEKVIEKIVGGCGFKIKSSKTVFFGPGENKVINNLLITQNGITVTDKYKNEVFELYGQYKTSKSILAERRFLGKFGFYSYINKKEAMAFLKDIR